jgi:hypothetical protein
LVPALGLVLTACRADPNLVAIIDKQPDAQVQMELIAAEETFSFAEADLEAAEVNVGQFPESPVKLFVDTDLAADDSELHLLRGGFSISVESWCETVNKLTVLDADVTDPRWCFPMDTGL